MSEAAPKVKAVVIKRDILLGAATITIAENEEIKARVDEQIKNLTGNMMACGAKLNRAMELKAMAEHMTEDEIEITAMDLEAIIQHIPTR